MVSVLLVAFITMLILYIRERRQNLYCQDTFNSIVLGVEKSGFILMECREKYKNEKGQNCIRRTFRLESTKVEDLEKKEND